jgi:hypothetical protein
VYTEDVDPRRDEWETKMRPALQRTPLSRLIALKGLSRRALINYRTRKSKPHPNHLQMLKMIVQQITDEDAAEQE